MYTTDHVIRDPNNYSIAFLTEKLSFIYTIIILSPGRVGDVSWLLSLPISQWVMQAIMPKWFDFAWADDW